MATASNIFIDLLTALGVPHTDAYSTAQFRSMPFRSLFGFTKLMERYGVECEGYVIADKSQLQELTPPLLAHTATGRFVIVNKIGSDTIGYESEGAMLETSAETFTNAWDGMVLLAFPRPDACEPDYAAHRRMELLTEAKKWVLVGVAAAIWAYLFVSNSLWRHLSLIGVMLIDMMGLWLTYMLLQKSKGVHTRASDRVCGVLQEGGMRLSAGHQSLDTLRALRLERSGVRLLRSELHSAHGLPGSVEMAGGVQCVLSAIYLLEHLVSEIQSEGMVHPLRERAVLAMGALRLLPRRRVVEGYLPDQRRLLALRRMLYLCPAGHQRPDAAHTTELNGSNRYRTD